MLRAIFIAFVLTLIPAGHASAQAAPAARIADMLERANAVNDVFNDLIADTARPHADRNEVRRQVLAIRDAVARSRPLLAHFRSDLESIEASAFAAADTSSIAIDLCQEAFAYLDGLDQTTTIAADLADALEQENATRVLMVRQRLWLALGIIFDGRVALSHARQQTFSASESDYYVLGSVMALYQGMRAIALRNLRDRASVLRGAEELAATSGEAGRVVVRRELNALPRTASRSPAMQALMLNEQALQLNDEIAAMLREAASDAEAGVPAPDLYVRYMRDLSRIERQYFELGRTPTRPLGELVQVQDL